MRNKKFMILITTLSLFWLIMPQAMSLAATYYVAPKGNDQWSGTLPEATNDSTNGPFKTIEKARDTIRQLKKEGKFNEPVNVFLREGTYFLDKTFEITGEDSGTSACPITYQAYSGEKVTISGGKIINNMWESYKGNIYFTNVGNLRFNSLFVNNKRAVRAREPDEHNFDNSDYYIMEGVDPATNYEAFNFSGNDIDGSWHNLNDVEVLSFKAFTQPRFRIDRVADNKVYFQGTPRYPYDWNWGWGSVGTRRYYVENVFEGLDEPGEWYLDNQTGDLYYWPLPGKALEQSEIIVPILYQIVNVRGADKANPVTNVSIQGIIFAHTDWYLPEEGYRGDQSAWRLEDTPHGVGPAVSFVFTNNCAFSNNVIMHTGATALRSYSENLEIICNEITDIGAHGIKLGVWDDNHVPDSAYYGITKNNIITDNTIYDIGKVYKEGTGIFVMISGDNTIAHNLIHNVSYSGISVGWGWTDNDTACRNNLIEYNDIYEIMRYMRDGAGIYTLGKQPGTIVQNNKIHDLSPNPRARDAYGIYLDQGSTNIVVRYNWIYRTEGDLVFNGGTTRHNLIENNIFASTFWRMLSFDSTGSDNIFNKNIVYNVTQTTLFGVNDYTAFDQISESDHNLFYNVPRWNQADWDAQIDDWRTNTSFDMNSIEEDPLFVDYANDDFNLMPQSPAFGLGFRPIDMSDVGPRPQDKTKLIKGDLNLDGKVNIQDVQACVNHISGTQDWGSAADINKDGEVNEEDVKEIIDIILGE